MPYLYKPKVAVNNYKFTTNNATLKAKTEDACMTLMTADDIYTIYCTYEPTKATAADPFYYVNIDGNMSLGNNGTVSVGAFRWIMRVESKYGTPSDAYARSVTFFDGEEDVTGIRQIESPEVNADGYYNLNGQRVAQPQKGLYIKNGRKVVMK